MTTAGPLDGRFWRIVSPRWSHDPLSGEGAARHGGRWNAPGQRALYLSLEIETAFAEYQQELGTRPGTFIAYDVTAARIVDLRQDAGRREARLVEADMAAPWKHIAWVQKREPASWTAALALAGRADGAIVPSIQREGGSNLVLWRWNEPGAPTVSHHDPRKELAR